jgi:hypothetical protein
VGLCPRLGFADRPACGAIEEERLDRHRRAACCFDTGRSTEHRVAALGDTAASARFAECCQSIIVESHAATVRLKESQHEIEASTNTRIAIVRSRGYRSSCLLLTDSPMTGNDKRNG